MNYDNQYDIHNLYPVQRKPNDRFHPATSDGQSDKELLSSKNSRVDHNPGSKKRSEARFGTLPDGRRGSATDSDTGKIGKRKMSMFPVYTVRGPNGQRVPAFVDYNFYNQRMAMVNALVSRSQRVEKSRLEATLDEIRTAATKIRLQGLRDFVQAHTLTTKLFWLLIFLICLTTLVYETKKSYDNYHRSPISTTFAIRTPRAIKFPDIYICFAQSLNRSYIRQHPEALQGIRNLYATVVGGDKRRRKRDTVLEEDLSMPWDMKYEQYMESLLHTLSDHDELDSEHERWRRSVEDENHTTLDQWNNDGEVAYDFLLKAGFKVSESFLQCSFQGYSSRAFNCSEIIRPVMDPNYFTCYVVSVPKEEQQVVASKGLRLLINSQVSLYPLVAANDTEPNKYAGLFVSVSDRFDPTNWYKGVVRTGTLTKLSLTATNVKLLNVESGPLKQPCVEESAVQYHVFNTSYSRTACQMDCLVYAFYKHCKCIFKMDKSLVRREILESAPFCAFSHKDSCLVPNVTNSTEVLAKVNRCRQRCHPPCNSTRYDIRGSASLLNPAAFPPKAPMQDLIQLEISFGRMEVSELVQSYSKTVAQMVADIGGNVNLWLGASMITLLEAPILLTFYGCYRGYQRLMDACC